MNDLLPEAVTASIITRQSAPDEAHRSSMSMMEFFIDSDIRAYSSWHWPFGWQTGLMMAGSHFAYLPESFSHLTPPPF